MMTNDVESIYVASSWRNPSQPYVVSRFRALGHDVYDFRNPKEGDHGFGWRQTGMKDGDLKSYITALDHPIARKGFYLDYAAMIRATICVLVLPCGRSAHLEFGWLAAKQKRCFVLADPKAEFEPELMYLVAGSGERVASNIIFTDIDRLCHVLTPGTMFPDSP